MLLFLTWMGSFVSQITITIRRGIDIVMLQDSGAEHLSFFTLAEREAFYKAFYNACRRTGKELWGNIETAEILARDWEHALEMERNGSCKF